MNTSKKLILENLTNITPLSSYPSCNFLDHYVFRDTLSGYSVYYPTTAYGGSFTSSTFNFGVTGGSLNKSCYQDFCFRTIYTRPLRLFCATNLTFVLSALDESVSNIVKIVYDFDDGTDNTAVVPNYITNYTSPKTIFLSHVYYPKNEYITVYSPTITVIYEDSCITTYNFTLCAFKCGIIDAYEKVSLIQSRETFITENLLLTLENTPERHLFNNLLLTKNPVFALPSSSILENVVEPVPVSKNIPFITTRVPAITSQPVFGNPVVAPLPTYSYIEGPGINLTPDQVTLLYYQLFSTTDSSIILTGANLPYFASTGILITV